VLSADGGLGVMAAAGGVATGGALLLLLPPHAAANEKTIDVRTNVRMARSLAKTAGRRTPDPVTRCPLPLVVRRVFWIFVGGDIAFAVAGEAEAPHAFPQRDAADSELLGRLGAAAAGAAQRLADLGALVVAARGSDGRDRQGRRRRFGL